MLDVVEKVMGILEAAAIDDYTGEFMTTVARMVADGHANIKAKAAAAR